MYSIDTTTNQYIPTLSLRLRFACCISPDKVPDASGAEQAVLLAGKTLSGSCVETQMHAALT